MIFLEISSSGVFVVTSYSFASEFPEVAFRQYLLDCHSYSLPAIYSSLPRLYCAQNCFSNFPANFLANSLRVRTGIAFLRSNVCSSCFLLTPTNPQRMVRTEHPGIMLDTARTEPKEIWSSTELNSYLSTAVLVDGYL